MKFTDSTANRRQFIGAVTVGIASATAGCTINIGDTNSNDGGADGGGEPTDTEEQGTTETEPSEPTPVSELTEGDLIFTEGMINPDAQRDTDGEWFEVYNARSDVVDLDGLVITDDNADEHTVSGPLLADPGEYVVFAASEAGAEVAGFAPDYVYDGVSLANHMDELVLSNGTVEIDRVAYIEPPVGSSAILDPSALTDADNDDPANWCESTTQLPSGDFGSPGEPNQPCE